MSLVENLINQISTQGLGGITKPFGFDMNDDTFANLLEKQMKATNEITTTNSVGQMGAPAGLIIEPLDASDGIEHTEKAQDQMEALGAYEVAPEDFALCEFVCTSKMELQSIVREALDYMRKELE